MNAAAQATSSYATRAELLADFDDDAEFVAEVVATFLSRCPLLLDEIRSGLRDADVDTVSRAAHSLKGSIGYFDHGQLYAAAQRIEHITAAELPSLPALLLQLEQQLGGLTGYLERECQQ
jgi:HPt (histidine-containing phosphotransfer) domain-containing protein